MEHLVCISSEAVNTHGSRVLTDGIDTAQYERNPILLYMHNRAEASASQVIGRVEGLTKEKGRLCGRLVFDRADPGAAEVERKWSRGFLNMVSAGLMVDEEDREEKNFAPGQKAPTITRCRLMEVSVVDIGACPDATRLTAECAAPTIYRSFSFNGERIEAETEENETETKNDKEMDNKEKEQTPPQPTEAEALRSDVLALKEELARQTEQSKRLLDALLQMGRKAGAVRTDEEETLIGEMARAMGADAALRLMALNAESKPAEKPARGIERPSEFLAAAQPLQTTPRNEKRDAEAFFRGDAERIAQMRELNPKEYARLFKLAFGIEAGMD